MYRGTRTGATVNPSGPRLLGSRQLRRLSS